MIKAFFAIIIIYFIMNYIFNNKSLKQSEKFYNYSNATTTVSGRPETIICGKSCCFSGWPNTIPLDESLVGIKPSDMGIKFRATNLTCNNGFTTGCVCEKI